MSHPSRIEIAESYALWGEYVDPHGTYTRASFEALSTDDKLLLQAECYGPEEGNLYVIRRMAAGNQQDYRRLMIEGQFRGLNHTTTADRCEGFADWVAYLPSVDRAVWINNGDPVWFDASSLDDAVELVTSGAELIN